MAVLEFPPNELKERLDTNEFVPNNGEISVVVCGDARQTALAPDAAPARIFGGLTGLSVIDMSHTLMAHDDGGSQLEELISKYNGSLENILAELAVKALGQGIKVKTHSSDVVEGNPYEIDITAANPNVDCKFNMFTGRIIANAASEETAERTAKVIDATNDRAELNTKEALEALQETQRLLGGEELMVCRQGLINAFSDHDRKIPAEILAGRPKDATQSTVIISFDDLNALPNGTDYFHSITAAGIVLPEVNNEVDYEDRALEAIGLVLGCATQETLGVPTTMVIPKS